MPLNRPPPARPAVLSEPEAQDSIIVLSNGDKLDVSWVSEHTGVPVEYFKKILNIENPKHNPEAKNKSGASGLFQVKDRTWLSIIKEYRNAMIDSGGNPVIPGNLTSDEDLLGLKNNPLINAHVTGQLAAELKSNLTRVLGREISDEETYMGHLLGQPDATKFLKQLDEDQGALEASMRGRARGGGQTLSSDVFGGTSIIKANPLVFKVDGEEQNVREVMRSVTQKLNKDDTLSGGSGRDFGGGIGMDTLNRSGGSPSRSRGRFEHLRRLVPEERGFPRAEQVPPSIPDSEDYNEMMMRSLGPRHQTLDEDGNVIFDPNNPYNPYFAPSAPARGRAPAPPLSSMNDGLGRLGGPRRRDPSHRPDVDRSLESPFRQIADRANIMARIRRNAELRRDAELADFDASVRDYVSRGGPLGVGVSRAPDPTAGLRAGSRAPQIRPPRPPYRQPDYVPQMPTPRRGIEYGRDRDDPSIGGPFMGEVRDPSILQTIWESLQPSRGGPQSPPFFGVRDWDRGR